MRKASKKKTKSRAPAVEEPAAEERAPVEHIDPVVKPKGADPATFVLDYLLANNTNVGLLLVKYQAEYEEDPVGVIERLLKLQPKADREKGKEPPGKPVGFRFVTDDGKGPI